MKRLMILIIATIFCLAACQTATPEPTNTPTATLTPAPTSTFTPAPTATPTLTATPEITRIGGVREEGGLMRYTSKQIGVSFVLPVEWLCVNEDEDLYTESLAEAKASMPDNPGRFEAFLRNFELMGNYTMYCFIPDPPSFKTSTDLALFVLITEQIGFNNILDIVEHGYGDTTCEVIEMILDEHQTAFSKCQFPTMGPGMSSITLLEDFYDILDGGRYVTLYFRGEVSKADVMAEYEQIVLDSYRFEP